VRVEKYTSHIEFNSIIIWPLKSADMFKSLARTNSCTMILLYIRELSFRLFAAIYCYVDFNFNSDKTKTILYSHIIRYIVWQAHKPSNKQISCDTVSSSYYLCLYCQLYSYIIRSDSPSMLTLIFSLICNIWHFQLLSPSYKCVTWQI